MNTITHDTIPHYIRTEHTYTYTKQYNTTLLNEIHNFHYQIDSIQTQTNKWPYYIMGAVLSVTDLCLGRHDHHNRILQLEDTLLDYEYKLVKHTNDTANCVLTCCKRIKVAYIMNTRQYVIHKH